MRDKMIEGLKSSIYEMEGLLELMAIRPEKEGELLPLVARRMAEAQAKLQSLLDSTPAIPREESEPMEVITSETAPEEPLAPLEEMVTMAIEPEPVAPTEDPVAGSELADVCRFLAGAEESHPELPDTENNGPEMGPAESVSPDTDPALSVDSTFYSLEDEDESRESRVESREWGGLHPAFCLNDRFRFCKSLFNGDPAAFNAAMERMAGFSTPEEAEAYFISREGFDPEDEETRAFFEIIRGQSL